MKRADEGEKASIRSLFFKGCTKGCAFFVLIYMNIELPEGIFERIMGRIRKEQRLSAIRRRLAIFSFGIIGSLAAFIPVSKLVYSSFVDSGFVQFFSLLFSDFGVVATYWQNFTMVLLETLPAISLAILLFVIFIFFESLRFLARDIKFILASKRQLIIN